VAYAEKIDGTWTITTPRQFSARHNMSVPPPAYEANGLFEVTVDPEPDAPGRIVDPGPIEDRDGRPVQTWLVRDPAPEEVEAERQARLTRAKRLYRDSMSPISAIYPADERDGWQEQLGAAQEVLAGGTSALVDTLAAVKGVTAAEMAQTIIAKRDQYRALYGAATARLSAARNALTEATTLAEIRAVDIETGWP